MTGDIVTNERILVHNDLEYMYYQESNMAMYVTLSAASNKRIGEKNLVA
jgi:hypothetical protein